MYIIESNFREIYHSLKYPGEQPFPLVANLSGTRIYDSRYCWGRMWHWFYRLIEWVSGYPHLQLSALQTAAVHTHTLFHQEMARLELPLKTYLNYLSICSKGYVVHEDAFIPDRHLITSWNASTKPFLKLAAKTCIFQQTVPNPTSLSFESANTSHMHTCQRIIDHEGYLGRPLPLAVIKKIIRKIPLNAVDQKVVDQWILKIDALNIPVKVVHKTIQALTKIYAKKNAPLKSHQKLVAETELFLEARGCKAFQRNDEKHIGWRQKLRNGQNLSLNGMKLTIGPEIFPGTSSGKDKTRAYAIEGQPDRIVLVANNCAALPLLDLRLRKESHMGLKAIQAIEISTDGRIALFERLKSLNTLCWTSNDGGISAEDIPMIDSLTGLVREFIKQGVTPSNFCASRLMLNGQGQLIFVKPVSRGPFDFNAIEDFLSECAAGNQKVFQELVEKSGLTSHSTAKFYHEMVKNALEEGDAASDDLAGIYKISDPKIVDRACVLAQRIKSQKKKLMMQLREQSYEREPGQLEAKANKNILKKYRVSKQTGTFGI